MTSKMAHWDQRYQTGDTPWDSGIVERELVRFLQDESISPGQAFELGCGAGTNAVYLAQNGFQVVAADCSEFALERARKTATESGVYSNFIKADLCSLTDVGRTLGSDAASLQQSFSFLFDRGCFHCLRKLNLSGLMETLEWLAAPHARFLMLCGNPNEQSESGPPKVTEEQIHSELGGLFEIKAIRAFHFEDRGGITGPLGWSCEMTRRST
ncbi:MAG: methyltransferase domain-containing protein [Planctomycetia bacterium]|nr:methyltransferase domain-containing protein [Planctomycetia bacterium]